MNSENLSALPRFDIQEVPEDVLQGAAAEEYRHFVDLADMPALKAQNGLLRHRVAVEARLSSQDQAGELVGLVELHNIAHNWLARRAFMAHPIAGKVVRSVPTEIHSIGVHPLYRRRGLATVLSHFALRYADLGQPVSVAERGIDEPMRNFIESRILRPLVSERDEQAHQAIGVVDWNWDARSWYAGAKFRWVGDEFGMSTDKRWFGGPIGQEEA